MYKFLFFISVLLGLSGSVAGQTPQTPSRYTRINNLFVDNIFYGLTTQIRGLGIVTVPDFASANTIATGPNPLIIQVARDVDNVWALYAYIPAYSLNPGKLERFFFDTGSATAGTYGPVTVNSYNDAKAIASGPTPKTIRVLYNSANVLQPRTYFYWPDSSEPDKLESGSTRHVEVDTWQQLTALLPVTRTTTVYVKSDTQRNGGNPSRYDLLTDGSIFWYAVQKVN